jgi:signal transduction histidine kinase
MTARLRASALRIRDSERRATLGDIARQVNHDLRNGLTPLRNVFRHLVQVGRDEPDRLAAIFEERRGTIDSGLSYLEDLSRNYSRLSSKGVRIPCDLNRIVRDLADALSAGGKVRFIVDPDRRLPAVLAEPTGLRRIVENLAANAIESLPPGGGTVVLKTERAAGGEGAGAVRLTVKDDGCGMDEEKRARIFDHFYTDKEGGSGLGLSIVRRLVTDFEGTIDVKSEPGRGTLFTVVLPAAPGEPVEEASP